MPPYVSHGVAVCVPRVRLTPLRRAPARDFCYARNALCARALPAPLPFAVFRAAVCRLSCRKRHPFARPKAAFRAPAIFDTHAALPSTIIKGAPSESPACRRTHAGAPRYIIPIDKTLLSIHTLLLDNHRVDQLPVVIYLEHEILLSGQILRIINIGSRIVRICTITRVVRCPCTYSVKVVAEYAVIR